MEKKEKKEMTYKEQVEFVTKLFWNLLSIERIHFDMKSKLDRVRKSVSVKSFNWETKKFVLNTGESFSLADINTLEITGEDAKNFRKKILPNLKDFSSYFKFAEGKEVLLYLFGEEETLKATLLKEYPYFFILERDRDFVIKSKSFISVFALKPYPLISGNIEVYEFPNPEWRKTRKELVGYLREIFKKNPKPKVTFALKDGREITGYIRKRTSLYSYFYLPLFDGKKNLVVAFWHAIDDLWEEEE